MWTPLPLPVVLLLFVVGNAKHARRYFYFRVGRRLYADNMGNGERVRYSSDLCRMPQMFKMIARLVLKIFAVIHRVCCHSLPYIRSLRSSIERGRG